jgi:hypothetical protein
MQLERESLEGRILRLERQNRTLKIMGSVVLLAGLAGLCLGVSAPRKSLETDLLLIKDASGSTRMILGMADGGPAITMLDANGKLRANIGVTDQGPEFDFLDKTETPRVQIHLNGNQEPQFNMLDNKGTQVSIRP